METRARLVAVARWTAVVALVSSGLACGGVSVAEGSGDATEIESPRPTLRLGELPAGSIATTIYAIQRPGSRVPAGASVVLDAPEIQVTAVADGLFWIQEAGASGLCEVSAEPVAYRGIAVAPLAIDRGLVPGQRVRVEGRVAELDGNTTIVGATVTRIGEPGAPYKAHCERDGAVLQGEALEGVLVKTSGTTDGYDPPEEGVWQLETCFAPAEENTFLVGGLMFDDAAWSPGWQWVTGVMMQSGARRLLEPRSADDVLADLGDDVCL